MSNSQNNELLENLFEEAYQQIKADNYLDFDEEGSIFAAQCEAQQKFEALCQWLKNF